MKSQTQLSRNSQFETALKALDDDPPESTNCTDPSEDDADFSPALDRARHLSSFAKVHSTRSRSCRPTAASSAACSPSSACRPPQPDDFISLRTWDRDGQERELGIVRHLEHLVVRGPEAGARGARHAVTSCAGSLESMRSSSNAATSFSRFEPIKGPPGSRCAGLRARSRISALAARCCWMSKTTASS